jgi:hypothetical protein
MAALFGGLLASCFGVTDDAQGARCASALDCPTQLACHAGYCVSPADGGLHGDAGDTLFARDGSVGADAGARQQPAEDASTSTNRPAPPRPRPPAQTPRPDPVPEQEPPAQAPRQNEPDPPAHEEPSQGDDDHEDEDEDEDDGDGGKHARACSEGCRGNELCQAGICCRWDRVACDGRCVNPRRDREHCGVCGNRCDDECESGQCTSEHGRVCLDDVCFDW